MDSATVVEDFKKVVFIDYMNKIHFPIENYRQGLLTEERGKIEKKQDYLKGLMKEKI